MAKLTVSRDLEALLSRSPEEQVPISTILENLNYRSHALLVFALSIPFVVPMPIMGLSTLFGGVMLISALSIISGLNPWIPKRWKDKCVPRSTLMNLIAKSDKVALKLERFVKPRWFAFSKARFWVRIHGVMILIAALILALPSPPGGNILPGAATMALGLGLVEEDGLVLTVGYVLTLINIVLLTLIIMYGLDWIMSFF
jgi:hypothetical protein